MIPGSGSRRGEQRFVGPEDLPKDKDPALPIPQVAPSARRERRAVSERTARRGTTAGKVTPPRTREEYPGPQTSSRGEHIEPGRTRPARKRGR